MQPNQHQSKSFKRFIKRWTKRAFITATILAIVYLVAVLYAVYNPTIKLSPPVIIDNSQATLTAKIDTLKSNLVESIRKCESAGYKESDGLIKFDSNEKASIGTMQFQKATVIYYYKTLYNKQITGKEAVIIALDDNLSGTLAKDIMFTTKNKASKDWYNCSMRIDADSTIDIINQLTK